MDRRDRIADMLKRQWTGQGRLAPAVVIHGPVTIRVEAAHGPASLAALNARRALLAALPAYAEALVCPACPIRRS
jgi:hypothetical protein